MNPRILIALDHRCVKFRFVEQAIVGWGHDPTDALMELSVRFFPKSNVLRRFLPLNYRTWSVGL